MEIFINKSRYGGKVEYGKITVEAVAMAEYAGEQAKGERMLAQASAARRWFEEAGFGETSSLPVIVVDHSFDKAADDDNGGSCQATWAEMLKFGFDVVTVLNVSGKEKRVRQHYVPAFSSPAGINSANSMFMLKRIRSRFRHWSLCGLNAGKLDPARRGQMETLCFSTMFNWDLFAPGVEHPDFRRVAVYDDYEVLRDEVVAYMEDNQIKVGKRSFKETVSDGAAIWIDSSNGGNGGSIPDGCTLRYVCTKVCAVIVTLNAVLALMRRCGKTTFKPDIYGRIFGIDDMPGMVMFRSGFKGSKLVSKPTLFSRFLDEASRMGRRFEICIINHAGALKDLPYQIIQCFCMNQQEAKDMAYAAWAIVSEYCGKRAYQLVGGNLGKAVKLFPVLAGDKTFTQKWEKAMKSWYSKLMGGRFPKCVHYHLVMMDPAVLLQWSLGIDQPKGLIPKGCIMCRSYKPGQKVGTYRMPNNDMNISILVNWALPDWMSDLAGLYTGEVCYFSVYDVEMTLKQMDFDGDKVGIFTMPILVAMAEAIISSTERVPLQLWDVPKMKKSGLTTDKDYKSFVAGLIPSPVGLCALAASKTFGDNAKEMRKAQDPNSLSWSLALMASGAATLVIDRAKNPDGKEYKKAIDLISSVAPKLAYEITSDKEHTGHLVKIKMGRFYAFAKSSPFVPGSFEDRIQSTKFNPQNGLDQYCGYLRLMESDLKLRLTCDWKSDVKVSSKVARMLASENGPKRINGFADYLKDVCKNARMLQQEAAEEEDYNIAREKRECAAEYFESELGVYCMEANLTKEELADAVACALYSGCKNSSENANLREVAWESFVGEIWLNNLKAHVEAGMWEDMMDEAGNSIQYELSEEAHDLDELPPLDDAYLMQSEPEEDGGYFIIDEEEVQIDD